MNTPDERPALLEARGLVKHYTRRGGGPRRGGGRSDRVIRAVDEVSVTLHAGEIVAVVGESGSGKTTTGRLMSRLELPTDGTLALQGTPVVEHGARALRAFRRQVQVVFQDPYASLNTVHTVGYHVQRPLLIHKLARGGRDARDQALRLLETVNLTPASDFIDRYPQQLSGGQRQRVAIARALAVQPAVIIADEPVASLDVSIRLSILNLFARISRDRGTAILYITHDIASARYFADRIVVMHNGRIVEQGEAEAVATDPQDEYTRLLISAAPNPDLMFQSPSS